MRKTRHALLILGLTALLCAALVSAAAAAIQPIVTSKTYWLTPGGKDSGRGTYEVPFGTFGRAISYASDGDVIIAKPGTYSGNWNWDLNMQGKRLTIRSEFGADTTSIDLYEPNNPHRFITFDSGETAQSSFTGFTFRNGRSQYGGAILANASPNFDDCVFEDCLAESGGAVKASGAGFPQFRNCTFKGNQALNGGAVSLTDNGGALFLNCVFSDNKCDLGGALEIGATSLGLVWSSLFDSNTSTSPANGSGGAVLVAGHANVSTCTFVNNSASLGAALAVGGSAAELTFSYNIVAFQDSAAINGAGTGETTTWTCNDFWNPVGGNFNPGSACNETTIGSGHLYVNPAFCPDVDGYDTINAASECSAAESPCGHRVGYGSETCPLICGDVNNSGGTGDIDISDLVYLVDFMVNDGPAPVPMASGNIDCWPGVDISDLVYLVDFMFQGGPAPCDCTDPLAKSHSATGSLVAEYKDGFTTIHLDTPVAIAGLEIELSGAAGDQSVALDAGDLEYFQTSRNSKMVLSFVDIKSGKSIPAGSTDIVRISGKVAVSAAVAVTENSERVDLGLPNPEVPVLGVAIMKPAYPNPFNPMVKLSFTMFVDHQASLVIYDVRGRRVAELLNESLTAGDHEVIWNGKTDAGEPAPSGVYFYSFKAGEYETTDKLLMLK